MITNKTDINLNNQFLKNEYKKYTKYIIQHETHIDRLYNDWVIDINTRNSIFHKLDSLIKSMMKTYNTNLIIRMQNNQNNQILENNIASDIPDNKLYHDLREGMTLVQQIERIDVPSNPFSETAADLITLSKHYGISSMSLFLKIYLNANPKYLFNAELTDKFEIYDKIFVPYGLKIMRTYNAISSFTVKKTLSDFEGLINNTCKIIINLEAISLKVVYYGYIVCDRLNTYIRTSQVCSKFIFDIKTQTKRILKSQYPDINDFFFNKHSKLFTGSIYLLNSPEEIAAIVADDYQNYHMTVNKNFNMIIKDFINNDIQSMHKIIMLFLLGNDTNINTAGLLFNLLKDKKIEGENVAEIIYHNLSYFAQVKLKKVLYSIKNEIARIKTLTSDDISIDKRLAALSNMPDNVKGFILEKMNEAKTGENNYKLQAAINGLMQFPWKPKRQPNEYVEIGKSIFKSRDYLKNVAKKIDETVYGHEHSKKILLELVGKWIRNPESTGQVIGLVGPPGVGKTLLAKSISAALNIPLAIVGLGGMNDAADLIGHSFTYSGAQYGMIVRQMIKAGSWRCVMFFDEVDKVSKRNDTNEIYNTLIHITDPNMNQHFQDRFYSSSIEFDLSGVLVVFSYNDSEKLDPILLDRIQEIQISAYSTQEKISIAQKYIINELCKNIGFNRDKITFHDSTIKFIIEQYTSEAGVRSLRRKLEQILLKLNLDRIYLSGPFKEIVKKKYHDNQQLDMLEWNDSDPMDDLMPVGVDNQSNLIDNQTLNPTDNQTLNSIDNQSLNSISEAPGLTKYITPQPNKIEELLSHDNLNQIFNMELGYTLTITDQLVRTYLDKPLMTMEEIHKNNLVGVINGLYATPIGIGGIVPIQIYKNYIGDSHDQESNLKLKITGNQKQVMKESVICALTVAINVLNENVKKQIFSKFPHGFHIHAPDGGTPKDGPSAGCAFATAFVSILLDKKINRRIAMTGEIELTGKISKIGGLDAKLHGAKKAGVSIVYISKENFDDYQTIRKKHSDLFVDNSFKVEVVEHIMDIITKPNVIVGVDNADFDQTMIAEYIRV